jgi:hypothetical protein
VHLPALVQVVLVVPVVLVELVEQCPLRWVQSWFRQNHLDLQQVMAAGLPPQCRGDC